MHSVLFPDSIAVVGASRRPESIGHHILANILAADFNGAVHAVNREAMEVLGLPAHARVSEIPDEVDLAVVAVPAEEVLDVVADCAEAGRQDPAGGQRRVRRGRARGRGAAVPAARRGPRSPGCGSSGPTRSASSTTTRRCGSTPRSRPSCRRRAGSGCSPRAGPWASRCSPRPPGAASASRSSRPPATASTSRATTSCSTGSTTTAPTPSASTSSRWATRASSRASPGGSPRPSRSSSSSPGCRPTACRPGHRARHTRVRPEAFDAMLRQAGVIRVENVHQMFDVAQLVVHQPLPQGNRVAIVGNSDALGALTRRGLRQLGAARWPTGRCRCRATPSGEQFAEALADAFADPEVDSVLTCFIPPLVTLDEDVAIAVRDAAMKHEKPCLATFLGMRGVLERLSGTDRRTGARGRPRLRHARGRRPRPGRRDAVCRVAGSRPRHAGAARRDRPRGGRGARRARSSRSRPKGGGCTLQEVTELLAAYGIERVGERARPAPSTRRWPLPRRSATRSSSSRWRR